MNFARPLASFLMLLAASTSKAEMAPDDLTAAHDLLKHFAALNSATSLESAGSHGSLGLSIGAGASLPPAAPDSPLAQQLLDDNTPLQGGMPRVWLMKGLPIPVDLAVTGARDSKGRITQTAGMLQWTAFEAFGLPAFTLRASHARLTGPQDTIIASSTAEAVLGIGFLRFFQLYGGVGLSRHEGSLNVDGSRHEGLALEEAQLTAPLAGESNALATKVQNTWTQNVRRAGLRVTILPPFVAMTVEAEWQENPSYAAKLSVGI